MAWQDFNKRIRSVNAKLLNAERRNGKDSKYMKKVYKSINSAYGTVGKTRFSSPKKNASLREIAKIDRALQRIELSEFFSKEGRERTYQKSKATWKSRNEDFDERTFDMFITAKQTLGSLIYGTSEQIINELNNLEEPISKKNFRKIVNEYREKMTEGEFEQGDEPQFFEYLAERSQEIYNEKMERRRKKRIWG